MSEDAADSARQLAEEHGLRFVDLAQSALAPGAASLLPEPVARRHHAVPIGRRLGTPVLAVSDPGDLFAMDALRTSVGREFVAVVARPDQVTRAINQLYGSSDDGDAAAVPLAVDVRDDGNGPVAEAAADSPAAAVAVDDGPPVADAPDGAGGADQADGAGDAADAGVADAEDQLPEPGTPAGAEPLLTTELPLPDHLTANGHDANGHVTAGHEEGADQVAAVLAGEDTDGEDPEAPEAEAPEAEGAPDVPVDAPDGAASTTLEESLREILSPPSRTDRLPVAPLRSEDAPWTSEAADDPAAPSRPLEHGSATADDGGDGTPADAPPPAPAGYGLVISSEVGTAIAYAPPLARVLVESGRVTPEDMADALREHQQLGESLARYLYNRRMATEEDLVRAMAQEVGLEFVDLSTMPIEASASTLIPEAVARHHMVLPIKIENGVPLVAMANPTDVFAMDDLRTIMGRNFTPVVATRSQIAAHLRYVQGADIDVAGVAQDAASGITGGQAGFELETLQSVVEDAPIVRYVNLLILQALNERASDIHIEPTPKRLLIRFRIDGVMHDATSASPSIHTAVTSRLKVLGEMDITEHRLPQEGRVSLTVSDRQIDLRLATLPSMFGETCVMRLLDKSASIRTLPDLGFSPDTLERYARCYQKPYGVILVTGPTGAGKTTTLYATLNEVVSKEKSVITVEDPVEYQIDGITQVQINKKSGLHFSSALKSILRADPDIVLIGEIRDTDTATVAMEAALSGHLVLSTLHTNAAAATPLRLTEMGIEPFLVTSSLSAVLTQRLARILCEQCKEPYEADEKEFLSAGYKEADLEGLDISTLHRAVGCRSCSHTGYLGRVALGEMMELTEEIDRMIIEQESIVSMERKAVEQGMRTLRRDGLRKALTGDTTLEEVLRVVV